MKFKKILLSLLICLSCFVQAKNITISRLTCEMQEGLVVVEGSPRLGWVMESPENGTRQSAYENLSVRLKALQLYIYWGALKGLNYIA